MKKSTLILLVICILIAVGAGYVWYQYNRKPADVKTEAAQVNTTATNLVTAFNDNEDSATQKYVGKIVSVSGKITDINVDTTGAATVFLESGDLMSAVTCSFYDTESAAKKNCLLVRM